jgi:hypothetical protein
LCGECLHIIAGGLAEPSSAGVGDDDAVPDYRLMLCSGACIKDFDDCFLSARM